MQGGSQVGRDSKVAARGGCMAQAADYSIDRQGLILCPGDLAQL